MKTVLVWYLITYSYSVHYSPPMPSLAECRRVQADAGLKERGRCVLIEEVVK